MEYLKQKNEQLAGEQVQLEQQIGARIYNALLMGRGAISVTF